MAASRDFASRPLRAAAAVLLSTMDIPRCIALAPRRLRVFSTSSAKAGSQCSDRRK